MVKFFPVLPWWTSHGRGNPSFAMPLGGNAELKYRSAALCWKLLLKTGKKNPGLKQRPFGTFCPEPALCQSWWQQPGCMKGPDLMTSEPFPWLFLLIFSCKAPPCYKLQLCLLINCHLRTGLVVWTINSLISEGAFHLRVRNSNPIRSSSLGKSLAPDGSSTAS